MTSIDTLVAKTLGKLSVTEVQYLYKVKDKIERMKEELEWMQCYLIDAEKPKEDQDQVTRKNMSDLRESAYSAEDIIDKYLGRVSHPREDGTWNTLKWFCHLLNICEAWTLHNLGSKIDKLMKKMLEHRYRLMCPSPNTQSTTRRLDVKNDVRQTYSHTQEEVVGLKEDVDTVVNKLIGGTFNVVGICGIGGLGKTTLARKVFTHQLTKQHFNCAWVYVSRQVNKINVFKMILNGLITSPDEREKIKKLGEEELPGKISNILEEKECLVVLDDIWTVDAWILLKPAFASIGTSTSSKSKILLTTRDKGILEISGIHSHNLALLNEEDSWKLFLLKAFPARNISVDAEMEALGKTMVKHCKGLPLAIVALAGTLYKKRTPWKTVLANISWYLTTYKEGEVENDLRWLELSYYDLPFYLKPCFLYLGNFPEDYKIKVERLYNLWDAEGFLSTEDRFEGETNLEVGERYLNELIQRSMVEVGECWSNGRIKSCRVHDIMRDICLKKCRDVCFFDTHHVRNLDLASIFSVDIVVRKRRRRCAVYVGGGGFIASKSPAVKEAHYLRSLFMFFVKSDKRRYPTEIISDIKKFFPLLRVLDLQEARIDSGKIPNEVGELIHLKYLSLRYGCVEKLPSGFWDLEYFVTLDLRCILEMSLPNKFKEMKALRHLYLPRKFRVEGGEKLTFRVDCMETLKNFNPGKCQVGDLLEMKRLRIFTLPIDYYIRSHGELKRLSPVITSISGLLMNTLEMKVVGSVIDEQHPAILTSLLNGLTKLTLKGYWHVFRRNVITNGMELFPQSLTHLRLKSFIWMSEVGSALAFLPHLELLHIQGISWPSSVYKLSFPANSYLKLKTLHIMYVKGSWEWKVEDGALPNLQRLVLSVEGLVEIPNNLPKSICIQCSRYIEGQSAYKVLRFTLPKEVWK